MRLIYATSEQPDDQKLPIAAIGGVVYRWGPGGQLELLLIKKQGGFWTLPKGHIKPGEDERDAVVREVVEETGISGDVEAVVKQVQYNIYKDGRSRSKVVTYYTVRAGQGSARPNRRERIQHVRWFSVERALKRIRRERIRRIVRKARAMLGASGEERSL